MTDSDKQSLRCPQCGTRFMVRLSNLPPAALDMPCSECGATIPLMVRHLTLHNASEAVAPPTAPSVREAEQLTEEWEQGGLHFDEEEGDHGGDWMTSYGDMITLLLAFFVLLFAISQVDRNKFETAMDSINQALGGRSVQVAVANAQQSAGGREPFPENVVSSKSSASHLDIRDIKQDIQSLIDQHHLTGHFELLTERDGLVVVARDAVLFEPGSATIRESFKPHLLEIGRMLAKIPNVLVIEGHTDNTPIATAAFPSNWELSVARATQVVRFLANNAGIAPGRMTASGAASYQPRYPMDQEHRQKNRRIEILVKKPGLK